MAVSYFLSEYYLFFCFSLDLKGRWDSYCFGWDIIAVSYLPNKNSTSLAADRIVAPHAQFTSLMSNRYCCILNAAIMLHYLKIGSHSHRHSIHRHGQGRIPETDEGKTMKHEYHLCRLVFIRTSASMMMCSFSGDVSGRRTCDLIFPL